MPKVRMTVAQHRCLARLMGGRTMVLDSTRSCYVLRYLNSEHAEDVACSTQQKLFDEGWIEWNPRAGSYEVTEEGSRAYLNASIR